MLGPREESKINFSLLFAEIQLNLMRDQYSFPDGLKKEDFDPLFNETPSLDVGIIKDRIENSSKRSSNIPEFLQGILEYFKL